MSASVRQALTSAAVVLTLLLLAGATYQGVATAIERRKYPHPGQLVEVGDHQLHIHCSGEGTPTVVLEAPAAQMSAAWGWVQPQVARTTRVCSYDRAGLGWSESGDRPYDPGRVPEELRALLHEAKEPGPYVLVGYGLGTAFVRRFAGLYPEETAALVLVAPGDVAPGSPRLLTMSPWLARAGLLRATGLLSGSWDGLPEPAAGAVNTFLNRPDHLTRASREVTRWDDAERLGREAALPERLPVRTIDARLNDEGDAVRAAAAVREVVAAQRARAAAPR